MKAGSLVFAGMMLMVVTPGSAKSQVSPPPFTLSLELAKPVELAGSRPTRNVLRVGLRGLRSNRMPPRAPVNLALVLDRSGSMRGEKLKRARHAARMVVERLGPQDILSLVAYDDDVRVLVPATRVNSPEPFVQALEDLKAGGSTALFAGVGRGIDEVRRFVDPARVDRVILLSDGQANIGPSAPSELGRLGAAAAKEGISVTTIGLGLGYNEDLMTRLALESDGNHGFAESAEDLAQMFDAELQDALSIVAESVEVRLGLGKGVRVLRSLNRPIERYPGHAVASLVQLRADQDKYFLLELELPASKDREKLQIVAVEVRARRVLDGRPVVRQGQVTIRYSRHRPTVQASENRAVMVSTIEAAAVAANRVAIDLRDQGRLDEAKATLQKNAAFLDENATRYASPRLRDYSKQNIEDAAELEDDRSWRKRRKKMRSTQHKLDRQQPY